MEMKAPVRLRYEYMLLYGKVKRLLRRIAAIQDEKSLNLKPGFHQ